MQSLSLTYFFLHPSPENTIMATLLLLPINAPENTIMATLLLLPINAGIIKPKNSIIKGNRIEVKGRQEKEFGGRRQLLMTGTSGALAFVATDSKSDLLDKYLKKSQENKTKNDKERLDSYYKRNYKDYFELLDGGLRNKEDKDLSESEKGILQWLDKIKK